MVIKLAKKRYYIRNHGVVVIPCGVHRNHYSNAWVTKDSKGHFVYFYDGKRGDPYDGLLSAIALNDRVRQPALTRRGYLKFESASKIRRTGKSGVIHAINTYTLVETGKLRQYHHIRVQDPDGHARDRVYYMGDDENMRRLWNSTLKQAIAYREKLEAEFKVKYEYVHTVTQPTAQELVQLSLLF